MDNMTDLPPEAYEAEDGGKPEPTDSTISEDEGGPEGEVENV